MVVAIAAAFIIIDQITKRLISSSMALGETHSLINGLLDFTYIHNDGAAYSTFQGKQTLLVVFTIALMIGIIVYMIVCRTKIEKIEFVALAMVLGGGIGNLIDRIAYSYVIDFINIHIIPIFNVADIGVTCGCILFAITVLFPKKK